MNQMLLLLVSAPRGEAGRASFMMVTLRRSAPDRTS
jgi:hypothetical protein